MSQVSGLSESVTGWLRLLRQGDEDAAQKLWERYFTRLVHHARSRLRGVPQRMDDAEDAALSAFASLCCGVKEGRFPRLADRHDLWNLLVAITANKTHDLAAYHRRTKRGGGKVRGDSAFPGGHDGEPGGIDAVAGGEPTPEFAAQAAEEFQLLLDALDEPLRQIALWKMECYTNKEIAGKRRCSVATVERKLAMIRTIWQKRTPAAGSRQTARSG